MRAVLAVAVSAVACGAPTDPDDGSAPSPPEPWREPSAAGPYAIAASTITVPREGLPPLVVEVWYPAAPRPGAEAVPYEAGPLRLPGAVPRDQPADVRDRPWPVVAFSHGFGGLRLQSLFLTEHLASHGFVVVAPDHAGTSLLDFRPAEVGAWAARRPTDVAEAVDALGVARIEGLAWEADRYAVVGHSFGAWTALVVAGGALDAAGFEAACAAEPPPGLACGFFEDAALDPDLVAELAVPDPRAEVAVALAPGAWYAFGPDGEGLDGVRGALVVGGTEDGDLPWDRDGAPTFEALGSPKGLALLEGAGHWGFTDLCSLLPVADCAGAAGGYLDPARTQALTRTVVLAWLRARWRGEASDEAHLVATDDLAWTDVDGP